MSTFVDSTPDNLLVWSTYFFKALIFSSASSALPSQQARPRPADTRLRDCQAQLSCCRAAGGATGAAAGVILSAMYMLTMYRDVVFGEITNPKLETITDLNRMEWAIFIPLIIMTLWLGVSSTVVTDITAASVDNLITNYNAALPAPAQ